MFEPKQLFIPIQKSKPTRRKPATIEIVWQGETTKLGYFLDWYQTACNQIPSLSTKCRIRESDLRIGYGDEGRQARVGFNGSFRAMMKFIGHRLQRRYGFISADFSTPTARPRPLRCPQADFSPPFWLRARCSPRPKAC